MWSMGGGEHYGISAITGVREKPIICVYEVYPPQDIYFVGNNAQFAQVPADVMLAGRATEE